MTLANDVAFYRSQNGQDRFSRSRDNLTNLTCFYLWVSGVHLNEKQKTTFRLIYHHRQGHI